MLGGCAVPQENQEKSRQHGQDIAALLPAIVETSAADVPLDVDLARERTCLRPEAEEPQTQTAWVGRAAGPVAEAARADTALDAISDYLTGEGWELKNETTAQTRDVRALYFNRGELAATATHHRTAQDAHLIVNFSSPCLEHPGEHRMLRSELDPEYGRSSQYYDDGGPGANGA
jgi:hypothetical protein